MKQHVEAGGGGGSGKLSMTLRPDGQLDTISRTIGESSNPYKVESVVEPFHEFKVSLSNSNYNYKRSYKRSQPVVTINKNRDVQSRCTIEIYNCNR